MAHVHAHVNISHGAKNKKRLTGALSLSGIFLITEPTGAFFTNSLALFADAGHMLTDIIAISLSLFAVSLSNKPATPDKTYGYHRAEVLAAMGNGVLLFGISLFILYEAYDRLTHPHEVSSFPMLIISSLGLIINIVSFIILKKGSEESISVKSTFNDVFADMLTSIGVIVASIIIMTTGWTYADPIISAGIGLFIFPRTWKIINETIGILLEGTPNGISIANVRKKIKEINGIIEVHDLHVWSLTAGYNALSAHVAVEKKVQNNIILSQINKKVNSEFNISHTTIQIENPGFTEHETHH